MVASPGSRRPDAMAAFRGNGISCDEPGMVRHVNALCDITSPGSDLDGSRVYHDPVRAKGHWRSFFAGPCRPASPREPRNALVWCMERIFLIDLYASPVPDCLDSLSGRVVFLKHDNKQGC